MTTFAQKLDEFFALRDEIFVEFGYTEDWRIFPIVDHRSVFWRLSGENSGGELLYADAEEALNDEEDIGLFSAQVYTYRHLKKWVYRSKDYTLVLGDTECDFNVWLFLLDNSKERPQ